MQLSVNISKCNILGELLTEFDQFSAICGKRCEVLNVRFRIGNLTIPVEVGYFDNPVLRHSDKCLGAFFREIDDRQRAELPAVYCFDVKSDDLFSKEFISKIGGIRTLLEKSGRRMPPVNRHGRVLYIGKREPRFLKGKALSGVSARMIAHFGYNTMTGLQLSHWRGFEEVEVHLSVYFLPAACLPYLGIIENMFALYSPPLLGRHASININSD